MFFLQIEITKLKFTLCNLQGLDANSKYRLYLHHDLVIIFLPHS